MAQGVTTSIRLPQDLRTQLDHAAGRLHRGKNWIVVKALQEYLQKNDSTQLAKEARKQSLLVVKAEALEAEEWLDNADTSHWE